MGEREMERLRSSVSQLQQEVGAYERVLQSQRAERAPFILKIEDRYETNKVISGLREQLRIEQISSKDLQDQLQKQQALAKDMQQLIREQQQVIDGTRPKTMWMDQRAMSLTGQIQQQRDQYLKNFQQTPEGQDIRAVQEQLRQLQEQAAQEKQALQQELHQYKDLVEKLMQPQEKASVDPRVSRAGRLARGFQAQNTKGMQLLSKNERLNRADARLVAVRVAQRQKSVIKNQKIVLEDLRAKLASLEEKLAQEKQESKRFVARPKDSKVESETDKDALIARLKDMLASTEARFRAGSFAAQPAK